MSDRAEVFREKIGAVLARFFGQNAQPAPAAAEAAAVAARLWELINERGLPPPLAAGERGRPGEMADAKVAPLVAHIVAGSTDPLLNEAVRQLVKACFYPEFKTCRDSFREVAPDGACRRQELSRARKRLSGSHCVDCPYWQSLTPEQHEMFLARNWRRDVAEFMANRGIFLPEDFRALRRWIRDEARARAVTST